MSVLLVSILGCAVLEGLSFDPAKSAAEAEALLAAGNLSGAATLYDAVLLKAPDNVDIVSGAAYVKLLQGNPSGADALLMGVEAKAGTRLPEVKLRRALVAMKNGDLDAVKTLATAAGTPEARLLVAEVSLADGDRAGAKAGLDTLAAEAGVVGETANAYLGLINDPNPLIAGLAEAQALWSLGQRPIAVRSVEDLVAAYAENREDGGAQLLLWAGRAATVGEPAIATNLLDSITVPPPGQQWRVQATRALVACAEGNGEACLGGMLALESVAPADGLADARATAALLIAERDGERAKRLLEGQTGDGAARAWALLGDVQTAGTVAMDPVLKAQFTSEAGG